MGMEQDTREFLFRIINTISLVLLWMLVNVFLGIYKDYAFFEGSPKWTNWGYYAFFILSLVGLLFYLRRKWKM
jgi:hypothetical protein